MRQKSAAKKCRQKVPQKRAGQWAFFIIHCGIKCHQDHSLPRVKANFLIQAIGSWTIEASHAAKSALILFSIASKVAASFATAVIIPGQLAKSVVRGIGVLSPKKSFTVETP